MVDVMAEVLHLVHKRSETCIHQLRHERQGPTLTNAAAHLTIFDSQQVRAFDGLGRVFLGKVKDLKHKNTMMYSRFSNQL